MSEYNEDGPPTYIIFFETDKYKGTSAMSYWDAEGAEKKFREWYPKYFLRQYGQLISVKAVEFDTYEILEINEK